MDKEQPVLPTDIIVEIVSRFPTKSIVKVRLLSKEFNELTYTSYFMQLHADRTGTSRAFLWQSFYQERNIFSVSTNNNQKLDFSLDFLPGRNPKILAVAPQGLMVCESQNDRRAPIYSISKPLIKEWKRLPNPKTRFFKLRTAMQVLRSNPVRFKILRLSDYQYPSQQVIPEFTRYICEIFDSETWRWKRLDDVKLPIGQFLYRRDGAVTASGAVHFRLGAGQTVLGFRLDMETWSTFPLPDTKDKYLIKKLGEYEGKLALMCMQNIEDCSMDVWIMEQYANKVWNKRVRLTNESLQNKLYVSPMAFHSSDIAVMSYHGRPLFSHFMQGTSNEGTLYPQQYHHIPTIFPFWLDYEPCSFMPPQTQTQSSKKGERKNKLPHEEEDGAIIGDEE